MIGTSCFYFSVRGNVSPSMRSTCWKKNLPTAHFFAPFARLAIMRFQALSALVHSYIREEFFNCALPNKISVPRFWTSNNFCCSVGIQQIQ